MVTIKDKNGNTLLTVNPNSGSVRKCELMKEDYILLKFTLEEPILFPLGCYADTDFGLFEVCKAQLPTINKSTGGYDYELQLDAHYIKWNNKIFKYSPENGGQEASWSLTATLDVHLSILLRNLQSLGYTYRGVAYTFTYDASVQHIAKAMTYENIHILDALYEMAKAWDCECWITDSVIHFGRCEFGDAIDFKMGDNVLEMSRSESSSVYATRLYVFGSDRNLPKNYRQSEEQSVVNGVVQRRLMLPLGTPFIDANEGQTQEEAIEAVVVFDDIYPKTEGSISAISAYDNTVENEDGTTTTETFYRFKDNNFTFSKDYILDGEELHVIFQSGSLNGMEFAVQFNPNGAAEMLSDGTWNPDAQLWEIVANEDYGRKLPDSVLKPSVGDKYVLTGWDSTKIAELGLVDAAEQRLLEEGKKYIKKTKIDPNTYTCTLFSDYAYNDGNLRTYELGDKVKLINTAYFTSGRESRIIGFEIQLDIPYDSPKYIVGESSSYSRLSDIEGQIETLTLKGQTYIGVGNGNGVYLIRTNDRSVPSDTNAFSAKRSLNTFLRKDRGDKTDFSLDIGGELTVKEMIRTLGAVKSLIAGSGTLIQDGLVQTDRIEVRQSMTVLDLIINELQGIAADYLFSDVGKVADVTKEDESTYILYIDKKTDHDFTTLAEGDIIQQVVNSLPTGGTEYYSSWCRVVSVNQAANSVTVVMYADSEVAGGKNYPPVSGYNVARRGNAIVPDEGTNERSQVWMLSSREGRIQFLQNVFKPILEDYNYALTLGKLPDIKALKSLPVTTDMVGLVAQTIIAQNFYQFDYNGELVTNKVDRGEWSAEIAQSESPYRFITHEDTSASGVVYSVLQQHTVWYMGCRWACLVDKTTQEPKWNATDWQMLEGYSDLRMEFVSSNGSTFAASHVDTEVTPIVYYGNIDISEDIAASDWAWVYDLGSYAGRVLHITSEMMPDNWSRKNKAVFTCTAYVRVGENQVQAVSNQVVV
jgi:hypothetical protein